MKKVISILLVMIMALSTFSIVTFSATTNKTVTKKNANYQYTVSGNNVEIKKYIGKATSVSIPSKIDNKKVTSIGVKAFYGNNKLKSVKIPTTVESIRGLAFDSCVNLKSVVIPNSVKLLGNAAFFSCTRLEKVTLSNKLVSMGKACFYNCIKLKSITLPSTLRNIGAYVFGTCKELKSVVINNGPTYISREMFMNCYDLKKVTLPNSVTKISRKSFYDCLSLSEINITDRITHIGSGAFMACDQIKDMYINTKNIYDSTFYGCRFDKLTIGKNVQNINEKALSAVKVDSLVIPSGVKKIGDSAFSSSSIKTLTVEDGNPYYVADDSVIYSKDKTKLIAAVQYDANDKVYTIPDGVKEIGESAFVGKEYKSVTIPETVTKIDKEAFNGCSELESIYIPNSVKEIDEGAFYECYSLTDIHLPEGLTALNKNVLYNCTEIKNLTIPESVKKIYTNALGGYSKETFNVPKNVSGISSSAFGIMNDLKNFTVDPENNYYTAIDGVLFSKDQTVLKIYPKNNKRSSYTLPNTTKEIGFKAFCYVDNIKDITLPTSVNKIDDYGIYWLDKISTIKIPSSVKSIGNRAIGYGLSSEGIARTSSDLAIIGTKNSAAHKYAAANNVSFCTGTPKQNVTSKSIAGGKSFTVKVANISQSELMFTSSNSKIATVDKNGKVTGIKKGTTTITASSFSKDFFFKITVTSNSKLKVNTFDDSSYFKFNLNNYKSWQKDYYKYNSQIKYVDVDNPSINLYTSNDYVFLHAIAGSKRYVKKVQAEYGNDYDQYIYFLYGTNMELSRFKLHRNTVLYRGSSDVSNITGTSYTLKDMKASIGKTYTDKTLVSTSIDHSVASNFYNKEKGAVLEIYAPKDVTVGGYIEKMSNFPLEREFLLASNTKYKVIDAGVRKVAYTGLDEQKKTNDTERYMKLLIVK